MTTQFNLDELIEAIAGAGAQLVMAKLATELHAAALYKQPVAPETAKSPVELNGLNEWQVAETMRLLQRAMTTLSLIADLDEIKQEPADSWREVLFRTIDLAQRRVDEIEIAAERANLNLGTYNDGTPSDS